MTSVDIPVWAPATTGIEPSNLARGQIGTAVVRLEIPAGCHVQSHMPTEPFLIATALELDDAPPGVDLGEPRYPEGDPSSVAWSDVVLDVYHGTLELSVPVRVRPNAEPGPRSMTGRLRYQGCTSTSCLWPTEELITVELNVVES